MTDEKIPRHRAIFPGSPTCSYIADSNLPMATIPSNVQGIFREATELVGGGGTVLGGGTVDDGPGAVG